MTATGTLLGKCYIAEFSAYSYMSVKSHKLCSSDDSMEDMNSTGSLQYDFGTIEVATNHFSDRNKLGEGGFGAVYKVSTESREIRL